MTAKITIPREAIAAFCRRWQIIELSFFGSVVRDDFGPDSDIDVLVQVSPETHYTLFDMVHMEDELRELLGREVDLVERSAIEHSGNYLRRKAILETAETVYAA